MLTAYWSANYTDRHLYQRVTADLSVARGTLDLIQQEQLNTLTQLAKGFEFRTNLLQNETLALQVQLQETRINSSLDFLRLLQTDELTAAEDSVVSQQLIQLLKGEPLVGLTIMEAKELDQISYGLGNRVQIPLIDTPRAVPSDRKLEDRAMVIRAVYPVRNDFGSLIGLLDSGIVLNNSTRVVDSIRDLVYGPDTLPENGIGTVTIFLDDVRISTNVPVNSTTEDNRKLSPTERAVGTRVSEEVYNKVLVQGERWVDRAFVVNAWYISAYQPLTDLFGNRIGMIYTGFNEAPFNSMYYKSLFEIALIIGCIMLLSTGLVLTFARDLLRPLKRIHAVARAVQKGQMDQRIGPMDIEDELGDLSRQFDSMLDLLEERENDIRQANDLLEHKVQTRTESLNKRTKELKRHIELLKSTREKMVNQEKLAVLGELTAGIAHEINNPAAVILGNMDLLIQELGEVLDPVKPEVELIIEQVYRIRALIDNLLQYSRTKPNSTRMESMNINDVASDTLLLVKHALDKREIEITLSQEATQPVRMDGQQIQQVLVNLILNAGQVMERGGKIQLFTRDWLDRGHCFGISIHVIDQGPGMEPYLVQKIFDPFFTTRDGGTGLGLAISRGIVQRHGGEIQVHSELDKGSEFIIYLPKQPPINETHDDQLETILTGLRPDRDHA